jgi:NCS1 family nucleobase:cation symporter-1
MDDVSQNAGTPMLPETGGTPPSATSVEAKGIEHITQGERWGRSAGLFWLWAGAVWNVEYVVYGTLLVVVFGLSFAQSVLVILLGNLFYLLTGFASLQGPVAGTTTFAISRAPFGPNGNRCHRSSTGPPRLASRSKALR